MGRFLTSDPYKVGSGSGDPADPQSWNRYAYTRGDPINRTDRTGLQDEGVVFTDDVYYTSINVYAYLGGMGVGGGGDGLTRPQDRLEQLPIQGGGGGSSLSLQDRQRMVDLYTRGLSALKDFKPTTKNCLKDLTAVGLDSTAVKNLATNAKLVSLNNAPPQHALNVMLRGGILAADPSNQTIYYNPAWLVKEHYNLVLGDVLHEIIHLSGFGGTGQDQDTNLQKAFGLTQDASDTTDISAKLRDDCFKKVKDPS